MTAYRQQQRSIAGLAAPSRRALAHSYARKFPTEVLLLLFSRSPTVPQVLAADIENKDPYGYYQAEAALVASSPRTDRAKVCGRVGSAVVIVCGECVTRLLDSQYG
jgi:hypothetical protein